jgi:subfamily B ATP-binding cassette protein MsbA
VENADRILVMDGGSIVEEGTHEQLLEKGGLYSKLFNMEFSEAC